MQCRGSPTFFSDLCRHVADIQVFNVQLPEVAQLPQLRRELSEARIAEGIHTPWENTHTPHRRIHTHIAGEHTHTSRENTHTPRENTHTQQPVGLQGLWGPLTICTPNQISWALISSVSFKYSFQSLSKWP